MMYSLEEDVYANNLMHRIMRRAIREGETKVVRIFRSKSSFPDERQDRVAFDSMKREILKGCGGGRALEEKKAM